MLKRPANPQVFEACHDQGLLRYHGENWICFNTGLACYFRPPQNAAAPPSMQQQQQRWRPRVLREAGERASSSSADADAGSEGGSEEEAGGCGGGGDPGRGIVVFLQRRSWDDSTNRVGKPWVVSANIYAWGEVVKWIGGEENAPPAPRVLVALAGVREGVAAPPLAEEAWGRITFDVPEDKQQQQQGTGEEPGADVQGTAAAAAAGAAAAAAAAAVPDAHQRPLVPLVTPAAAAAAASQPSVAISNPPLVSGPLVAATPAAAAPAVPLAIPTMVPAPAGAPVPAAVSEPRIFHPVLGAALAAAQKLPPQVTPLGVTPLGGAPLVQPAARAALNMASLPLLAARGAAVPVVAPPLVPAAAPAPSVATAGRQVSTACDRDLSVGLPGPKLLLVVSLGDPEISSGVPAAGASWAGFRVLVAAGTTCGDLARALREWALGLVADAADGSRGGSSGAARLQRQLELSGGDVGAVVCWEEREGSEASGLEGALCWGALAVEARGEGAMQLVGPRIGLAAGVGGAAAAGGAGAGVAAQAASRDVRELEVQLWLPSGGDSGGCGSESSAPAPAAAWPLLSRCAYSRGTSMALEVAAAAAPDWWGPGLAHLQSYLALAFTRANEQRKLFVTTSGDDGDAGGGSTGGAAGGTRYLIFNTGLFTRGLHDVFLLFTPSSAAAVEGEGRGTAAAAGGRPWVFHSARSGPDLALLGEERALPAAPSPPAAATAGLDSSTPISADWDALLHAPAARAALARCLTLGCGALPEAALRGALEVSLRRVAHAPALALPCAAAPALAGGGERTLWAVPLFLDYERQAVQLVLIVEAFVAWGGAAAGVAPQRKRVYKAVQLLPFEQAYGLMRGVGSVDWVAWVRDGLEHLASRLAASSAQQQAASGSGSGSAGSAGAGGGLRRRLLRLQEQQSRGGGGGARWLSLLLENGGVEEWGADSGAMQRLLLEGLQGVDSVMGSID